MYKKATILAAVISVMGCANADYKKSAVKSNLTGFYSYTKSLLTSTSVQAIQLNGDGTGYTCNYSIGKPGINKVPIKHIGNGVWASASFGTAEITKNGDGSVSWGPYTTYYPESPANTNC